LDEKEQEAIEQLEWIIADAEELRSRVENMPTECFPPELKPAVNDFVDKYVEACEEYIQAIEEWDPVTDDDYFNAATFGGHPANGITYTFNFEKYERQHKDFQLAAEELDRQIAAFFGSPVSPDPCPCESEEMGGDLLEEAATMAWGFLGRQLGAGFWPKNGWVGNHPNPPLSAHGKRGTKNKANTGKHERGERRSDMDKGGEKKDKKMKYRKYKR